MIALELKIHLKSSPSWLIRLGFWLLVQHIKSKLFMFFVRVWIYLIRNSMLIVINFVVVEAICFLT